MKKIVVIGTLDNRDEEVIYLKKLIQEYGYEAPVMDIGFRAEPKTQADITAEEVAKAAGERIEKLRNPEERQRATQVMIEGAVHKLRALCQDGEVAGMIAAGGLTTLVLVSSIMQEMPYNIPKLIMSSGAAMSGVHRLFGTAGITLMHSLIDVRGLNSLLEVQLRKAAAAICSMAEVESVPPATDKPRVAVTTFGYLDNCTRRVRELLAEEYELIGFHATGMPDVAMEKLIEEDFFQAVIDLVPSSITHEKFGGPRISWHRRLEVAGEKGLPQVVAPGGVNTTGRAGLSAEELTSELQSRKHYWMDKHRVTMFLTEEELRDMAPVYAEKLNKAKGPTKFLIPKHGWLSIDKPGSEFYSPESIKAFVAALRASLKLEIEVIEVEANIDEPAFAEEVVRAFREVMKLARHETV